VAAGSDSPTTNFSPFSGFDCALNTDRFKWKSNERVSIDETVNLYTENAAKLVYKSNIGKIAPGYLADLVVLNKNIYTYDRKKIIDIKPILTIVDGKVVYRNKKII
jgi:predicted amidohydrolase YtcJ